MRVGLISAVVALTALAAYVWTGPLLLSNPPKALIIDGWWQRDYALNACRSEHPDGCPEDMIGQEEYTYSGELMAQLSANKDCTDVVVHYFARPDGSDKETLRLFAGPHMMLMVDYVTNRDDLWWSISGPRQGGSRQGGVGHGTPKEIAETVCAIVVNPGAWK
jgi:hypothetical protein